MLSFLKSRLAKKKKNNINLTKSISLKHKEIIKQSNYSEEEVDELMKTILQKGGLSLYYYEWYIFFCETIINTNDEIIGDNLKGILSFFGITLNELTKIKWGNYREFKQYARKNMNTEDFNNIFKPFMLPVSNIDGEMFENLFYTVYKDYFLEKNDNNNFINGGVKFLVDKLMIMFYKEKRELYLEILDKFIDILLKKYSQKMFPKKTSKPKEPCCSKCNKCDKPSNNCGENSCFNMFLL